MRHVRSDTITPCQLAGLAPEAFLRLLHPADARGLPNLFVKDLCPGGSGDGCPESTDPTATRVGSAEEFCLHLPSWLDCSSYVTLNRFWGRRRGDKLAALNALYLDLDFHTHSSWRGQSAEDVRDAISARLQMQGIVLPSICISTGRGLALIWLIDEMPAKALPRWQAAMDALIEFGRPFGADAACRDAVRVFRLPGTLNEKSGREVRVIGGTGLRVAFSPLADQIFGAVGRPTRKELLSRKKNKQPRRNASGQAMPQGLSARQRFGLIFQDLQKIRDHYYGSIPVGMRNNWLHLCATALAHSRPDVDLEAELLDLARQSTPGLSQREVLSVARHAVRQNRPGQERRYYYRGSTIADMLGVTDQMAQALNLEQAISDVERRRRKLAAQCAKRRVAGAKPRAEYEENSLERSAPWRAYGFSRATYFRRRKAGTLPACPNTCAQGIPYSPRHD
ncbi:hypothetical protein SAMN06265370_106220 [Puniceibacterium sediminis]|uniref:Uncharacterized protein n=2 Tax=Puniceibacterium sediminis TaxID=1608407 RepID=A0A238WQB0_9RHOB|nr:hypothetical protein SAMN06265370_106220 [Puniceibacterium sediminis]